MWRALCISNRRLCSHSIVNARKLAAWLRWLQRGSASWPLVWLPAVPKQTPTVSHQHRRRIATGRHTEATLLFVAKHHAIVNKALSAFHPSWKNLAVTLASGHRFVVQMSGCNIQALVRGKIQASHCKRMGSYRTSSCRWSIWQAACSSPHRMLGSDLR